MTKLTLMAGAALLLCLTGSARAQGGPFPDVPATHPAAQCVNGLVARGIFNGYPDGTFGGNRAVTRYEFVVAMQRLLEEYQRKIETGEMTQVPDFPLALDDREHAMTRYEFALRLCQTPPTRLP